MIYYKGTFGFGYVRMLRQVKGSVFPKALMVALPCAMISAVIKFFMGGVVILGGEVQLLEGMVLLHNHGVWSGFSFLVGFLIVFRTSQAYSRFWEGCESTHRMRGDWYNASSAICSFCIHSGQETHEIQQFKQLLIRLISLLHATALADIEDCNRDSIENVKAFSLPLIDIESLDPGSLMALKATGCKVELIFTWIQQLLTKHTKTGLLTVPPPILSRAYQELGNGMVSFHQAVKIATVPFPFPYAQTCEWLLVIHFCMAPFMMAQWTSSMITAAIFTFVQVCVLWALNLIAVEIENPFGSDDNDLDYLQMQVELNRQLVMLASKSASALPSLVTESVRDEDNWKTETSGDVVGHRSTLLMAWKSLTPGDCQTTQRSDRRRGTGQLRAQGTYADVGLGEIYGNVEGAPQSVITRVNSTCGARLAPDAKCQPAPSNWKAQQNSIVGVAMEAERPPRAYSSDELSVVSAPFGCSASSSIQPIQGCVSAVQSVRQPPTCAVVETKPADLPLESTLSSQGKCSGFPDWQQPAYWRPIAEMSFAPAPGSIARNSTDVKVVCPGNPCVSWSSSSRRTTISALNMTSAEREFTGEAPTDSSDSRDIELGRKHVPQRVRDTSRGPNVAERIRK